jgi:hypothetical protein
VGTERTHAPTAAITRSLPPDDGAANHRCVRGHVSGGAAAVAAGVRGVHCGGALAPAGDARVGVGGVTSSGDARVGVGGVTSSGARARAEGTWMLNSARSSSSSSAHPPTPLPGYPLPARVWQQSQGSSKSGC